MRHHLHQIQIWLTAITLILAFFIPHSSASEPYEFKIGVRAYQGAELARKMWQPTIDYLNQHLPEYRFHLVPVVDYNEFEEDIAAGSVDFIISDPAFYVQCEHRYGVTRIATLEKKHKGLYTSRYGCIIFTRTNRHDIQGIKDLKDKSIMGVAPRGFAGWLMAVRELYSQDIDPDSYFSGISFAGGKGPPVVKAVEKGIVDAGTVRTGLLEMMESKGLIRKADFKILDPIDSEFFPYETSTKLYPEFPFAKLSHVHPRDGQKVLITLLAIQESDKAAKAGRYARWAIPQEYSDVINLMQELELEPFIKKVSVLEFFRANPLFSASITGVFGLLISFLLIREIKNRVIYAEKQRLAVTLSSIGDGIISTDTEGKVTLMNMIAEELTGWSLAEASGRPVTEVFNIVNEKNGSPCGNPVQKVLESGTIISLANHTVLIAKDGSQHGIADSAAPIFDSNKNIIGVVLVFRDVSERKRTKKQVRRINYLREELLGLESFEKKLEVVTDTVVDVFEADFCRIWIIKPGDLCHSGCPHAEVTEGPHVCRQHDRCLHLAASSGRYSGLDSKMHGRVPFGCYKIGRIASGDIKSFITNDVTNDSRVHDHEWARQLGLVSFAGFSLFSEKGDPLGVLALFSKQVIESNEDSLLEGLANNISQIIHVTKAKEEKLRLESQLQQAQKMEAIGLMAGGVAHDLNNILSGIVGYPEILLMDLPEESSLRKPIEAIHQSGLRAVSIVADLLTVARGIATTKETVNLNDLILEHLNTIEHRSLIDQHQGVTCTTALEPELAPVLCSDVHIRKCLMNLILNGVEAIGQDGVITVATRNHSVDNGVEENQPLEQGDYVVLSITDTGEGIRKEDILRIYEPFYTKKVLGRSGTGLGLSVVWNIVEGHDGHITVESSQQGTCFEIYLPVSKDSVQQVVSTKTDLQELHGQGEKILVIDDESLQRDIATRFLSLLEYHVETVKSGEEAIIYLQNHSADLLILDMKMDPGINGRQTYEQIIKNHPGQKAVIASGFSEDKEVRRALQLGAGQFIKKPYSIEQLALAVQEVSQT